MKLKSKVRIIGGGISGCSIAHFLKDNFDVTLYEKSSHLGGLSRTMYNQENLPYQKGSHILHTNEKWIIDLINKVVPLTEINYTVGIDPLFDFRYYDFPFTQKSLDLMPWHWQEAVVSESEQATGKTAKNIEQLIINFYGESAYYQFFKGWIEKWFHLDPKKLTIVDWFRKYLRNIDKTNFYRNNFIYFPKNYGYNTLFDFFTKDINVEFNVEKVYNDFDKNDIVISTIRPDKFVEWEKKLDVVSVSFDIDSAKYAENKPDTVIYPNYVPFLSINQSGKCFENDDKNIVVKVFPNGEEEADPVPKKRNYNIIEDIKNVYSDIYFIGRLGSYQFLDMADCIKQAADTAAFIKHKERLK